MRITIVGQGYVGYALATAATKVGHSVIGFDTNPNVISKIRENNNLINYLPTSDEADIKDQDIYVIAVPTPLDKDNRPDVTFLKKASSLIARSSSNGALVINESTSYPGTLREIVICEIEKENNSKFMYAAAPERIDPANTEWSIKNTPRVISGVDEQSTNSALEFYRSICDELVVVRSPEIAECAKLFENTFRQVNIALVNELAQISEKLDISATEVIQAASTKPFGFMKFNPSLGVGGHCIPIDPIYLAEKAESLGASARFIRQANSINQLMPDYILSRIKDLLGGVLIEKRICIVGLSYKANVADLRESPSLSLRKKLIENGAKVFFHDEIVKEFSGDESTPLTPNAFDLALVAVHHENLDIDKLRKSTQIVFDCTGSISEVNHL